MLFSRNQNTMRENSTPRKAYTYIPKLGRLRDKRASEIERENNLFRSPYEKIVGFNPLDQEIV